jgi:hypothetical protein
MRKSLLLTFLLSSIIMVGCTSEYDLCIDRQKEEYRQRNPKASYGQIQSKQFEFEMMCSSYKKGK